ncbi:MAG: ABC-F family ATP-binding cassette domain-containing protein [Spirochaetia bacterium]|jgi:ATP-binding cassette subfamily F protein 3|nr:ABC-F family ATP-binding cassette domain-containing protein [Spirochaetia bacterium]
MGTLQITSLNLAFADRDILDNISLTLDEHSRSALAGSNGCGKSTMLKCICHIMVPDSMNLAMTKDLRVSYLPQSDIVLESGTVIEEAENGYKRFLPAVKRIKEIEARLAHASEGEQLDPLLLELHELQEKLLNGGWHDRRRRSEQILKGLGFKQEDLERTCSEFSGGWQMRIALAKVLLESPDILLLDEPTNYLDIEAKTWLKNYLAAFRGGLMLVSHDQGFLDATVNEVYELYRGQLTRYSGNYSSYLVQREAELQQLEEKWKQQQAMIGKTEQFIERFRYKATKSKQVQSRLKMLDKVEEIQVPSHLKKLHFSFPPAPHSGNDVLTVSNLKKSWGDNVIFDGLSFLVRKQDRLAVTGRNGEGKSTLLRMLCGRDREYGGVIKLGAGVRIGYFAQDTEHTLDPSNTVIGELEGIATTADVPRLRNYLGAFLFEGDDVFKPISVLSGGERSRLALLKILLHPVNLLILDEPTNHLDINAKEMLAEALRSYEGTMIFVSHDTYFIEQLATRILYLSEDAPQFFEGDYGYFARKLDEKERWEEKEDTPDKQSTKQALGYKETKEKNNRMKKLQRENELLLSQDEVLQQKIDKVSQDMSKSENYSDATKITKLMEDKQKLEKELKEKEDLWLKQEEEIEELQAELQ